MTRPTTSHAAGAGELEAARIAMVAARERYATTWKSEDMAAYREARGLYQSLARAAQGAQRPVTGYLDVPLTNGQPCGEHP